MLKPYTCHKKNCWTTNFNVLTEAASKEEEHPNEDLDKRATPHSHNEQESNDKEHNLSFKDPNENEQWKYQKEFVDLYDTNDVENYEIGKDSKTEVGSFSVDNNHGSTLPHDHKNLDVNEFLYEYTPSGGIRHTPLLLSLKGQLIKKGILVKYLEDKFDTYR